MAVTLRHATNIGIGTFTDVRDGGRVTLQTGSHTIVFSDVVRRTLTGGVAAGETSATPGYTLTFTPAP